MCTVAVRKKKILFCRLLFLFIPSHRAFLHSPLISLRTHLSHSLSGLSSSSTSSTHEARLILISKLIALIHSPVSQAHQRRRPMKLDSSSSTTSLKLDVTEAPSFTAAIHLRPMPSPKLSLFSLL